MKRYIFFGLIILAILITSCNRNKSLEEEYVSYSITSFYLKIFNDNSFQIENVSDVILDDEGFTRFIVSNGVYKKENDKLILSYEKRKSKDTLYYVEWGERKFLFNKTHILFVANKINQNQFDQNLLSICWTDTKTENKPLKGKLIFPKQFSKFLLDKTISAKIVDISVDSLLITVDKGEEDGLFYGCELSNGENRFNIKYLYKNSSQLYPSQLFWTNEIRKGYNSKDTIKLSLEKFRNQIKDLNKGEILYTK